MEFWFGQNAEFVLKAGYTFALFGVCFCVIGAFWFIVQHARHSNLRRLLLSSGFVNCLGGGLVCLSLVVRIGVAPAPALDRMESLANFIVMVGVCMLIVGWLLERREKSEARAAKAHFASVLAGLERGSRPRSD